MDWEKKICTAGEKNFVELLTQFQANRRAEYQ